jgi:hypothetical protein
MYTTDQLLAMGSLDYERFAARRKEQTEALVVYDPSFTEFEAWLLWDRIMRETKPLEMEVSA